MDGFDVVFNPGDVTASQATEFAHPAAVRTSSHPAPHKRRVKKIWSKTGRKTSVSLSSFIRFRQRGEAEQGGAGVETAGHGLDLRSKRRRMIVGVGLG